MISSTTHMHVHIGCRYLSDSSVLFVLCQLKLHTCSNFKSKSVLISISPVTSCCSSCVLVKKKRWSLNRGASLVYVSLSPRAHAELFSCFFHLTMLTRSQHYVLQRSCSLTEQRGCAGARWGRFDQLRGAVYYL